MHVNEVSYKSSEQTIVGTQKTTSTPAQQHHTLAKSCKNTREGTPTPTQVDNTTACDVKQSAELSTGRETCFANEPAPEPERPDNRCLRSQTNVNKRLDFELQKSFVDTVSDGKPWQVKKPDENWITVQRKRLRNRFIGMTGQADPDVGNFRAAESKVPILVYNVDKEATVDDVRNYIYDKIGERVSLYKLRMQREKNYDSYKIFVTKSKLPLFLDNNMWPCNIRFRQFINFRDKTSIPSKSTGQRQTIN
ncbi:hypothetical protein O0L34_g11586 [Tuta absoluta]|nr:hypothetical protein O0L34_g11586 [Tuta absoluta]